MSVSIGFGFKLGSDVSTFLSMAKELVISHSYGLDCGVEAFEKDVKEGVETICNLQSWDQVCCLKSPINSSANLAFGIHEELVNYQMFGKTPTFFEFCKQLTEAAKLAGLEKLGVFFASEWLAEDKIRIGYGNISRLIAILSLPGHWTVCVLNPATKRMEEWDELPYFFDISLDG